MLGGLRWNLCTEVALDPRVTVNEGSFVLGADFLTSLSGFFHKIQST